MALELAIRVTTIDDALTYFQIDDENSTLTTAKQYGQSGNPARASLGLFLYVTKKEVGDDIDSEIYGGLMNGDPVNAASWQLTYGEDNWYESVLIAAQVYAGGITYVLNDIAYYSGRLWKSLNASHSGNQPDTSPSYWLDVTADKDDILTTGITTYYWTVEINDALIAKSSAAYAKKVADNTKNGICSACDHEDKEALDRIDLHLQAAGVADYQQLYTQAQWNIETLKTLTE